MPSVLMECRNTRRGGKVSVNAKCMLPWVKGRTAVQLLPDGVNLDKFFLQLFHL